MQPPITNKKLSMAMGRTNVAVYSVANPSYIDFDKVYLIEYKGELRQCKIKNIVVGCHEYGDNDQAEMKYSHPFGYTLNIAGYDSGIIFWNDNFLLFKDMKEYDDFRNGGNCENYRILRHTSQVQIKTVCRAFGVHFEQVTRTGDDNYLPCKYIYNKETMRAESAEFPISAMWADKGGWHVNFGKPKTDSVYYNTEAECYEANKPKVVTFDDEKDDTDEGTFTFHARVSVDAKTFRDAVDKIKEFGELNCGIVIDI